MEPQFLINVGFAAAGFFGGWIINSITRSITRLEDKMSDFPLIYVNRDDYKSDINDIKQMLSKIFDKLDGKADK
jgi:hypothetical protein